MVKRVLSENTFLRLRTRFSDSEHVSPKFLELGVRSFGKRVLSENTFLRLLHVFSEIFLLTPNSENFGETCSESEKRVLTPEHVFQNS